MKTSATVTLLALLFNGVLVTALPNVAVYTIKFSSKDDQHGSGTFQCDEDTYLLDAAENAGFDWPYSGRSGTDAVAAGRLVSGEVDQSDQSFLDDDQIAEGFILTDVAYPKSDCEVEIGVEDDLY